MLDHQIELDPHAGMQAGEFGRVLDPKRHHHRAHVLPIGRCATSMVRASGIHRDHDTIHGIRLGG